MKKGSTWADTSTVSISSMMQLELPSPSPYHTFQLFGLARSPSMEFKEVTKRDAQNLLAQELDKLRIAGNLPEAQAQMVDREFDGFKDLFAKFLASESQDSIKWDKIEKLPTDAVSNFFLSHSHFVKNVV